MQQEKIIIKVFFFLHPALELQPKIKFKLTLISNFQMFRYVFFLFSFHDESQGKNLLLENMMEWMRQS